MLILVMLRSEEEYWKDERGISFRGYMDVIGILVEEGMLGKCCAKNEEFYVNGSVHIIAVGNIGDGRFFVFINNAAEGDKGICIIKNKGTKGIYNINL